MKASEAYKRTHQGGPWLSTMREFLKSRAVAGEFLTWGSNEEVRGLTVTDLEEISMAIAACTMQEVLKDPHKLLQKVAGLIAPWASHCDYRAEDNLKEALRLIDNHLKGTSMNLTIESETDIDGWTYWGVSINGQRPSVWFLRESKAEALMDLMKRGHLRSR